MRLHQLSLVLAWPLAACGPAEPLAPVPGPQTSDRGDPLPVSPPVDLAGHGDQGDKSTDAQFARLLVVDDKEQPVPGAWVEVLSAGNMILMADSEGVIMVPPEAHFVISAGAEGFAMKEELGTVESKTLRLQRCTWVELTIPESLDLPEEPVFLAVSLDTELSNGGSRTPRTAVIDQRGPGFGLCFRFGKERRVRLAAPGGPQFLVAWWLVTDSGAGDSNISIPARSTRINLAQGEPPHSFEVSLSPAAIQKAILAAEEH